MLLAKWYLFFHTRLPRRRSLPSVSYDITFLSFYLWHHARLCVHRVQDTCRKWYLGAAKYQLIRSGTVYEIDIAANITRKVITIAAPVAEPHLKGKMKDVNEKLCYRGSCLFLWVYVCEHLIRLLYNGGLNPCKSITIITNCSCGITI